MSNIHAVILRNSPDLSSKLEAAVASRKDLIKQCGKRYFNAIVRGSNNPETACSKTKWLAMVWAVKGKKNITKKLLAQFIDTYIDIEYTWNTYRLKKSSFILNVIFSSSHAQINGKAHAGVFGCKPLNLKLHQRISDNTNLSFYKEKKRKRAIVALENYAPTISGERIINLSFSDDPTKIKYNSFTESGEKYTRSCKWRKTDLIVNVVLPLNWFSRVYRSPIGVCDGMLTLNASTPLRHVMPIDEEILSDGCVFAAKWISGSRGSSFKINDGFIATGMVNGRRVNFHGKTLKSTVRGLQGKIDNQALNQSFLTPQQAKTNPLIKKAMQLDFPVSVKDSYAVGNCKSGTLDFCYRHGLPYDSTLQTIPLSKLAKCAALEPRREVLALISYILKKASKGNESYTA